MFKEIKQDGEVQNTTSFWSLIFTEAADLIEREGWCQRRLITPNGEHCLLGAIYHVHSSYEPEEPNFEPHISLSRYWCRKMPKDWESVYKILQGLLMEYTWGETNDHTELASWNDFYGRKGREVIGFLRFASKKLEGKQNVS